MRSKLRQEARTTVVAETQHLRPEERLAAFHGAVRASLDADVLVAGPEQRLTSLEDAFSKAGLRCALSRGDPGDPIAAQIRLGDAFGNRVDVLAGLCGARGNTER